MRDFYSVLRVAQKADDIAIKASFRKLVKAYHPDLQPDDMHAQQTYREIVQAYECLSDRTARQHYDALLADKRAKARQRFKRLMMTTSVAFLLTTTLIVLVAIGANARSPNRHCRDLAPPHKESLKQVSLIICQRAQRMEESGQNLPVARR